MSTNRRSVMSLYSGANDPHSHAVRIVLEEKGVTYDAIDVDSSAKAREELLESNPYGKVPMLIDRDLILYKAEIIAEYLDERFPHPPLLPVYPVLKASSRLMLYRINKDWYSLFNSIIDPNIADKTPYSEKLINSLVSVTPVFVETPYFLSEEFSLVDCFIAPLLWRLPKLGIELPSQAKPIQKYADSIFNRESFQASLTDSEKSLKEFI